MQLIRTMASQRMLTKMKLGNQLPQQELMEMGWAAMATMCVNSMMGGTHAMEVDAVAEVSNVSKYFDLKILIFVNFLFKKPKNLNFRLFKAITAAAMVTTRASAKRSSVTTAVTVGVVV